MEATPASATSAPPPPVAPPSGAVAAPPAVAAPAAAPPATTPEKVSALAGETKPPEAKAPPAALDDKWEPKVVEGIQRDAKVIGAAREAFKGMGLNAEQAQGLIDFTDKLAQQSDAAAKQEREQQEASWWKEVQADKEVGGPKFEENLVLARRAVRELMGETGPKQLKERGIDNWPPLVRLMVRAGALLSEDTVANTTRETSKPATDDTALMKATYPKSPELWGGTPTKKGA